MAPELGNNVKMSLTKKDNIDFGTEDCLSFLEVLNNENQNEEKDMETMHTTSKNIEISEFKMEIEIHDTNNIQLGLFLKYNTYSIQCTCCKQSQLTRSGHSIWYLSSLQLQL